jgi:hypothetical protein
VSNHKHPLVRAACALHRRYQDLADMARARLESESAALEESCRLLRVYGDRHRLACSRGWHGALEKTRRDLLYVVRHLNDQSHRLLYSSRPAPRNPPSIALLLAELRQLDKEFETVQVQTHMVICVHTESIVMEDIELGPFAIQLHPDRFRLRPHSGCFDCVALAPNPAHGHPDTTHPHVQNSSLCAGDAFSAISAALEEGRLCDGFLLVAAVLRNYNPASPYVSLEQWNGIGCRDCQRRVNAEEINCCEFCDREVCDHCMGCCDLCDTPCCRHCLERDSQSRQSCCPSCRETCHGCNRTVNHDDFDANTGFCPHCLEQNEEEPEDEEHIVEIEEQQEQQSHETIQQKP